MWSNHHRNFEAVISSCPMMYISETLLHLIIQDSNNFQSTVEYQPDMQSQNYSPWALYIPSLRKADYYTVLAISEIVQHKTRYFCRTINRNVYYFTFLSRVGFLTSKSSFWRDTSKTCRSAKNLIHIFLAIISDILH